MTDATRARLARRGRRDGAAELAKYIESVPAVNHEITERLDVVTHR